MPDTASPDRIGTGPKPRRKRKRRRTQRRGRWWVPSVGAVVALAVLAAGIGLRIADPWFVELVRVKTFDLYNRAAPRVPPDPSPIVIVDIDEKSLAAEGQWPWPRTKVAELLASLRDYGVGVAGFDIVFAEPDRTSPERLAESRDDLPPSVRETLKGLPSNEEVLAQVMRTVPTVLGQAGSNTPTLNPPHETAKFTSVKGVLGSANVPNPNAQFARFVYRQPSLIHNIETLTAAASGLGYFSVEEEVDGFIRRVPLVTEIDGIIKPTLSIEMLRVGFGGNSIFATVDLDGIREIRLQTAQGNYPIPTDANGRIWVYFAEPDRFNTAENTGRIYISATDVMNGRVDPSRLKGKLALVGTSAVGLLDIRSTPIEPRLPGVEVHANILENIIQQDFIRYPGIMRVYELLMIAGAGILLIFLIPRVGPLITLVGLVTAGGAIAATSWYLFTRDRTFLDVTYPGGLVFAVFAVLTFANYTRDAAEKRQVRSAFGQYLSPDLVEQLAEDPDRLKLGGETKRMTLLFCDVRGFTTISESYKDDPQGLTLLINRLLTPLTREILNRDGTIDKYMGDCIMAFWNAPIDVEDQEAHACEAALAMMHALDGLNEERRREAADGGFEFLPLAIGIGINTGDCVVGNMGSDQRFDYSVLGDAVNLASRLEGQSKSYAVDIVIGPDTAERIAPSMPVMELDLIAVKGKKEAVRIFTLMGGTDKVDDPEVHAFRKDHDRMLAAYRAQDWDTAEAALDGMQRRLDGTFDGLINIYRKRIAEFHTAPPPTGWNGVYVAESK